MQRGWGVSDSFPSNNRVLFLPLVTAPSEKRSYIETDQISDDSYQEATAIHALSFDFSYRSRFIRPMLFGHACSAGSYLAVSLHDIIW